MSRRRIKVLVADPEADQRMRVLELVASTAEQEGLDVTTREAGDATTAMAAWSEIRPDVVVAEVLLPGMSGLAMLRRMKTELETLPAVVLVTTLARESDRYWGLRNGAIAYVTKPYEDAELERRLVEAFEPGAATRERRPFAT